MITLPLHSPVVMALASLRHAFNFATGPTQPTRRGVAPPQEPGFSPLDFGALAPGQMLELRYGVGRRGGER